MVAKIDTSEVLSTWSFRAGIIIVSVAGLLAAALAFTGLIWQRRQRLVYQALYQAELESQALRGHFEYLVKYANDIIFLTDENYHIVEVNDRAVETYGYTRQEMLGMPLAALMPPGDLPSYQSRLRKIQQKGKIVAEGIHQRKDGSTFPVEVSGRTIKIEDKTYLQEIVRDITERKAREQEYQAIIHAAIDGFWQADMQGHFLDVNEAYCQLTGYSLDEILNMSITDIEAIEKPGETAKRIRKIKEVGYDRFETRHRRKDGEIVDVEISVNYLPIDGGRMFVFIRDITERMDMEESLRLSEQNFRDSIENSPLGIRIANEDGKTLYTNRALLDIYGYSSIEELEAVPRKQRYIPESYDEHRERTKKRRQGEFVPTNYEISIVRKDGDVRHLAASRGEVLWDDEKQFQVVYQDITERKQAEEKLRESEEKYQALFELGLEAVFLIDNQTSRILEVNAAASDMYGYSREELLAMRNTDLSAEPEDTKKVTTSTPKGSVIVPLRFHRRKDGSVFPVEISGRFFTWKEHSVHVAAIRDITERKQAEEALQESEEKYRSLVERANEGICIIQDGIVEYLNPRLAEMWSGTVKEFIGTPFIKHLHPDNLRKITGLYKRRVAGKDVTPIYEITLIRKDGSKLDVEVNAGVISYKGKPADLVVIRDITERKMAEEERKQLELKAQITSRLASVGEMAAGVAHEINNPLTAVTGYAQLLVGREDIPSDIRSDLEAINDGARRVAGIVRTLLAFSRQTKPERKLVDINELIESTLILRAYHLRVNNIEVVTRLATDVLETVADPGQIQQVLLNLIVNAEMEMKLAHGKGKLTITTEKSRNTIKICVKDNGPGIKSKVMDKIFDPFFTTREVGEGTGLGLSLCYGIVAEHKGKIYAESKPGKGATFIIELPVVTEVAPPKPAKPVVKKSKKAVKARILVVDDEQVVRDVVNRVLTGEGHKVEIADNAADALNKIESKRYKLILVDIKMPGIDGVELYKRIQKINKSLARRVVFITGDIMGADTEKFLAETKVAHIDKPFNAEQLSTEVQRALTAGR
jgi:PAS domain S-box-containing protein